MPGQETSHFWLGRLLDERSDYFKEIYNEEDEDREHTPLSRFAADQGETWYDHDFMETGFKANAGVAELIAGHSYADQWGEELIRRAGDAGLDGCNLLVFITASEIAAPRSVEHGDVVLHYLGTITYDI